MVAKSFIICGFLVLVRAFWEEGKVNEALEAVRDMEQRGIVGTPCVYYELARCLCFHGRYQEAILEVSYSVHNSVPLESGLPCSQIGGSIHLFST